MRSQNYEILSVGMLEVNCYLVASGPNFYVIDPGDDPEKILSRIRTLGAVPTAILLTHGHIDHIGAVRAVSDAFGALPVFLAAEDHGLYFSPANALPPFMPAIVNPVKPVSEWETADFEILPTPGHTRGCVCFYFKDRGTVFSGDTLFRQSIGRTDLPGGDFAALERSIRETLYALPENTVVLPGHGPETSVGYEATRNPFIAR